MMVVCVTTVMINELVRSGKYGMLEAFDAVYQSKTYRLLIDPQTGLYRDSPCYVLDCLLEELGLPMDLCDHGEEAMREGNTPG